MFRVSVLWWCLQWKFRLSTHTDSLSLATHTVCIWLIWWDFLLYFTTNFHFIQSYKEVCVFEPSTQQDGPYFYFFKILATRRISTLLWMGWKSSNMTPPAINWYQSEHLVGGGWGYLIDLSCPKAQHNELVRTVMNLGCSIQSCIHFWLSHSHSVG